MSNTPTLKTGTSVICLEKCVSCIYSAASIETVTPSLGKSFKWICKAQETMQALHKVKSCHSGKRCSCVIKVGCVLEERVNTLVA